MPKAFPTEFREDVIRVFKETDASVAQVAKDFGISPSCLRRWLTIDERRSASASVPARASSESDALREANKRIKLLEQENEVLRPPIFRRRTCRENDVSARPRAGQLIDGTGSSSR
ncbi:transposase [Terrabacter sp. Ter38]|uniref:transposase n=1 Tax=Terrabacter sp. Ter38 TaxID=2926030 RepID=UPI002118E864|nr:transposase [Terrabacter sp. Ter38]